jgi:SAM-dependent methyltransferase
MILNTAKKLARAVGIDTTATYQYLSTTSIEAAIKEQGLAELCQQLRKINPDVRDQYSGSFDEIEFARYWEKKMRGLHAWQVRSVQESLDHIGGENIVISDIGDSSGNHATYLKALARPGQISNVISVNLDPIAVDKINKKGGEAILSRAEDLDLHGIKVDFFMSFETVEHLTDPVRFLHSLATKGHAEYLFMSVPYRRKSRFGGTHLRQTDAALPEKLSAESVHIFELCPEDWLLLARFAGFKPVFTRFYFQYPKHSPLRLLAPMWRKLDFEGFFGVLLRRDLTLADRYQDW